MKLIIQGENLSQEKIRSIVDISKAKLNTQTSSKSWRLDNVDAATHDMVMSLSKSLEVDIAFLPDDVNFKDYKLLAMDMDCTFIQIECIDEIADLYGVKDQVAAITHASMNGELDFNESLTRRVALLKGLEESALQTVFDKKLRLSPGAEIMLDNLKKEGIKTLLVSGGFTFFTEKLKEQYQLDYTRANTLEIKNGMLTGKIIGDIVNAEKKAETLLRYCNELGIEPKQTIAMGDGANDLKMLHAAGLSIAYHAKPKVKAQADISFDYVGLDGVINLFK
ncbi:MAG: phosphoserine phosphatase SerB [Pseudopedobacter saltans]|uniref:Phosphoserine phosphatase n=1 Tax=Pseudopedobacter saltans TaxID=151895 RepID=A0A2W5FA25_9SPHI|nr:MAG: phosphoserine phosphatase SerB [Pseudopedobacter saltans]